MSDSTKPLAASQSERTAADTLPLAELEPEISGNIANASKSIAIIGGGLAGMAAAAIACEAGLQVDLFEQSDHLGGRACSMEEPWNGQTIDQCQHVAMGCCTNFLDFCRRASVEDCFQRHKTLHFIGPDGRQSDITAAAWLPAPYHLLPGLFGLKYLTKQECWSIARTLRKLNRLKISVENSLDTIGLWLQQQGQSGELIEKFWSTVIVSALSETVDNASLFAAKKVFADGFMSSRNAYELIMPRIPLGKIFDLQVPAWLERQGVRIHRGTPVKGITCKSNNCNTIILANGEKQEYQAFIVAIPWYDLGTLDFNSPAWFGYYQEIFNNIKPSGITAVHLWFDRPITYLPHAALVGRLSQWIFDKTVLTEEHAHGKRGHGIQSDHGPHPNPLRAPTDHAKRGTRWSGEGTGVSPHYYQVVISAAHRMAERNKTELLQMVLKDIEAIFPDARQAILLNWRIVTMPRAVFSMLPGVDRYRIPPKDSTHGFFFAGDWTATGWPGTMEGAVRSGYLAAEGLLKYLGR
ncbi:MAG: hydroxysqualene dehydroxylase HpnE [Thermoguttaceae bacterium]|jgi:squalene-associated FAD-dependent desaturase